MAASSDLSYEDGDTLTQTETDAASHASSELPPALPLLATTRRVGDTLRPRRLGTDHTFCSGGQGVLVGVQVHCTDPDSTAAADSGAGAADAASSSTQSQRTDKQRDSIYEVIPSEKEFGTLGNARPAVLRNVSQKS